MLFKTILYSLVISSFIFITLIYYSDKNISEREYSTMLDRGDMDIIVIENYMAHHQHAVDWEYDQALRLALLLDKKYLNEVVDYYSNGTLRLDIDTANFILQQLPSESIAINHVAGRILASNEFSQHDPFRAVKYLEYSALRDDKNAAETLSQLYTQAECYIEAITWAKIANKRSLSSECTQLPIDVNLLNEEQWDAVLYNEKALEAAGKNNHVAKLKYSANCTLTKDQ